MRRTSPGPARRALRQHEYLEPVSNPSWGLDFLADSVVNVPFNPALNPHGPFSIEFWAKPSSPAPDLFSPVCSLDEGDGELPQGLPGLL